MKEKFLQYDMQVRIFSCFLNATSRMLIPEEGDNRNKDGHVKK